VADRGGVGQQDAQRLRGLYAQFARGDLDAVVEYLDPDVEWHNPEYAVEPGIRRGADQFRAAMALLHDSFEYEEFDVEEITQINDSLFAAIRVRVSGKGSGAPIDERFFHVWRLRAGKAISMKWFADRDEALAAAALPAR
jgi:ketosteroid isomerase-like protein